MAEKHGFLLRLVSNEVRLQTIDITGIKIFRAQA